MHEQDTKKIMVLIPERYPIDVEIGPGATVADLKKVLNIPLHALLCRNATLENVADDVDLYAISEEYEQYITIMGGECK